MKGVSAVSHQKTQHEEAWTETTLLQKKDSVLLLAKSDGDFSGSQVAC